MKLIEIEALDNGAHRNQTALDSMPVMDGWAIIPEDMETPNFPFGEVEVDYSGEYPVVTKWTPGEMPEPTPEPEPIPEEGNVWDELDAAYQEGVNAAYDE